LATAAVVGSLLLGACSSDGDSASTDTSSGSDTSSASSAGEPVVGGTLVDLQNFSAGEPAHIDPSLASELQGAQIGALLYDGLTEFDFTDSKNPELKGAVAEEYAANDTADEFTFTMRDSVNFSDGTPVTPSSFKAAWERANDPEIASDLSYLFLPIQGATEMQEGDVTELSGVVADDEAGTLVVTLTEPFADFPAVVSHPAFSPMPEAAIAAGADWEKDVMVGNGPFAMQEAFAPGAQEIVLVRNDDYWGGLMGHNAYVDEIQFKISKDIDSAYNDFEAGNGQTAAIPSGQFAIATETYPNATEPSLGLYYFAFNDEDSQVGGEANVKLRQAISMAIDRESINAAVYDGSRRMPSGITPPGVPGFEDGLCGDLCSYDPEAAKALYDEWVADGGALDDAISVQFNAGAGHEDVVNIIQANLADNLGIEIQADGRDSTNYFTEMREGQCVFCRAGWIWDYPVYDNAMYALTDSASIDGDNLARYSNPEVDAAIQEARSTLDDEARGKLYADAERTVLQNMNIVPLNWYAGNIVYDETVQNYLYTPLQFTLYEELWLKS